MEKTRAWRAVGIVVLSLAACGGSGGLSRADGGDAGGPPPTATEFCQQVEASRTALYIKCYGGKASDWPIFVGRSACPTLAQEIAKGTVTYDPTKANACLVVAAKQPACDELWPAVPCIVEVLRGAVAEGQRCDNAFACQTGTGCSLPQAATSRCTTTSCQRTPDVGEKCESWCETGASCVAGMCVPNLAPGARCGEVDLPGCSYGFYCATDDAQPTCKKLFEDGPCTSSAGCFDHQFCDTTTSRCRARLGLGGNCAVDLDSCQSFTACDPVTKTCVEASHPGQLCGNILGFSFLCEGGTCQFGAESNRCVAQQPNGATCTDGVECTSRSCVEGKCAARPTNDGAACEDFSMCSSDLCSAGICVAPAPNGAPCSWGDECASGLCTAGVCVTCG